MIVNWVAQSTNSRVLFDTRNCLDDVDMSKKVNCKYRVKYDPYTDTWESNDYDDGVYHVAC